VNKRLALLCWTEHAAEKRKETELQSVLAPDHRKRIGACTRLLSY
jgi:hypothetical protein